jgi:hypothetical protein
MMAYAENFCKLNEYKMITMHSRMSAVLFYEKLGFTKIGNEFKEVGIPHIKMYKQLLT